MVPLTSCTYYLLIFLLLVRQPHVPPASNGNSCWREFQETFANLLERGGDKSYVLHVPAVMRYLHEFMRDDQRCFYNWSSAGPDSCCHKLLIYIEHHSVCLLVGTGTPPTPLLQASVHCALPPGPKGGGHIHLRLRGWGSSNSNEWIKSLALCLSAVCRVHITKVCVNCPECPSGGSTDNRIHTYSKHILYYSPTPRQQSPHLKKENSQLTGSGYTVNLSLVSIKYKNPSLAYHCQCS
jgi:hypothetical protein